MLIRIKQLISLLTLLKSSPKLGAEVGVYEAHLSWALLDKFPNLNMILVDSWKPFNGGDWVGEQSITFFAEVQRNAMKRIDSVIDRCRVIDEASPEAASKVEDNSLDFVFIDANHKYESVCKDIRAWWPKLKPGGLLSGHDYVEADDLLGPGGRGVKKAVLEFSNQMELAHKVGLDTVWWIYKLE